MQNIEPISPLAEEQAAYPQTKTVVQLDGDGYFIGLTQADLSPLEAEQGVYLLPSGAIDVTPPEEKAGYVAKWQNNEWHYLPDYRGATAYSTTDKSTIVIDTVGDVPVGYTLLAPTNPLQMWDGRNWHDDDNAQKTLLEQKKERLIKQIADKTDQIKSQILVGYPQAEIDSFYRQEKEALAYQADPQADVPMLRAIAAQREMPLDELVEKVLAKAALFAGVMGGIIGQRQAIEDHILMAKNQAELTACEQEIEQWQPNQ